MNLYCPYCDSKFWAPELRRKRKKNENYFGNQCCQKGIPFLFCNFHRFFVFFVFNDCRKFLLFLFFLLFFFSGLLKIDKFPESTQILRELFLGDSKEAKFFQKHIRKFNCAFAMTSMGAKACHLPGNGPPTVKIQGQVIHRIGNMGWQTTEDPNYLQIYFLDPEAALERRKKFFSKIPNKSLQEQLNTSDLSMLNTLLARIQADLLEFNQLAKKFTFAKEMQEKIPEIHMVISADQSNNPKQGHKKSYELPISNEMLAVIPTEDFDESRLSQRDLVLTSKNDNKLTRIHETHQFYDALSYPLFYPYGNATWHQDLKKHNAGNRSKKRISMLEYYRYQLHIKRNESCLIFKGKKLLQQWCADIWAKIEQNNLNFILKKETQKKLKQDSWQGLSDALADDDLENAGKIMLPSSFSGSPRQMHEKFLNAMAMVASTSKPDFFITFTCNPSWPEIHFYLFIYFFFFFFFFFNNNVHKIRKHRNELDTGEQPCDRPDIVSRVFRMKLEEFKKDIFVMHKLGKSDGYLLVIEFQKRGLPHAHILLILEEKYKMKSTNQFDHFISAELPNKTKNPKLYEMVVKHMIHGPCGVNTNKQCMKNNMCEKRFPKKFQNTTSIDDFGYVQYKRRKPSNGAHTHTTPHGTIVDNSWVVPYNPALLLKYNCHINVEVKARITAIKYLCSYLHKGTDKATIKLYNEKNKENKNEVKKYIDCRVITASEGAWKILNSYMSELSHSVTALQLHLPNEQTVTFKGT